jgi:hypothetical protein
MLAATFIATLFVPMFFRWIAGWRSRGLQKTQDLGEADHA